MFTQPFLPLSKNKRGEIMSKKKWALRITNAGADQYEMYLLNIKDQIRIWLQNVDDSCQPVPTTEENEDKLNKLAEFLVKILNEVETEQVYSAVDIYTELMKKPAKETGRFPESGYYWIKFHSSSTWSVREYFNDTDTFVVAGEPFKARDVYKIYPQRLILPNEILASPQAE